jgi:hypothetical protein
VRVRRCSSESLSSTALSCLRITDDQPEDLSSPSRRPCFTEEVSSWPKTTGCPFAGSRPLAEMRSLITIWHGRHSDGATLAVGAALIRPDHIGILALASLPTLPKGWQGYGSAANSRPQLMLAWHGGKDRHLAPDRARLLLESAFGAAELTPLSKHLHVIEDEDHVLHLDSTWVLVHATILEQLGLIACVND